jgi:hypothetical protein
MITMNLGKSDRSDRLPEITSVIVVCLGILALAGCATLPQPREPDGPEALSPRPPVLEPVPAQKHGSDRPALAIVIDDVGDPSYPDTLDTLVATGAEFTYAILPFTATANRTARELVLLGREVLAHVPMEPINHGLMVGEGFLMTHFDDRTIRSVLAWNIESVPGAVGINNHMGSLFTQHRPSLEVVMDELRIRGLFFLDSRTNPGTLAQDAARDAGIPVARRHVFLDDDPAATAIDAQLREAERQARILGCAVAIGHARPETVEILKRWVSDPNRDVDLVPLSRLLGRPCSSNPPAPSGNWGQ